MRAAGSHVFCAAYAPPLPSHQPLLPPLLFPDPRRLREPPGRERRQQRLDCLYVNRHGLLSGELLVHLSSVPLPSWRYRPPCALISLLCPSLQPGVPCRGPQRSINQDARFPDSQTKTFFPTIKQSSGRLPYSGTFPCFFRGVVSVLCCSISSARMIRHRVSRGSITSSMYPRSAAT